MSTTPTYEFDESTTSEMVACMCFDSEFLRRTDGLVEPAYFPNGVEAVYAQLAIDHFRKYGEAPSATVWKELVKHAFKTRMFRDDQKVDAVTKLGEIARLTVRSRAWLLDAIAEFARQQALTNALFASARELGKTTDPTRFERVTKVMQDAMGVALKTEDQDYDYFEQLEARTAERLLVAGGGRPKTGITTGVPELDDCLFHKGWGRRELSLLMGGAKSGKSFGLTFFGANAVKDGKNVLIVSLENSIEIAAMRIDAQLSGIEINDQFTSPHAMEGGVKVVAATAGIGRLKIRHAPAGSFTPADLQRMLDDYKTKGIVFDLVVIDYMDIMAANHRTDNNIENSKSIFVDVRAIAHRENLGILSATQTNREGHGAAVAKATHIAEDFNRIRIADVTLALNRTEDERAENKLRITFAACRNQPDGSTIFCKTNLGMGTLIAEVESVE